MEEMTNNQKSRVGSHNLCSRAVLTYEYGTRSTRSKERTETLKFKRQSSVADHASSGYNFIVLGLLVTWLNPFHSPCHSPCVATPVRKPIREAQGSADQSMKKPILVSLILLNATNL